MCLHKPLLKYEIAYKRLKLYMIARAYSCVHVYFILKKIFEKILVERKMRYISAVECGGSVFLGAVVEAYQCGSECAPISGVIAELVFKGH